LNDVLGRLDSGLLTSAQLRDRGVELCGHFRQQVAALPRGLAGGDEQFVQPRTEDALQFAFDLAETGA